MQDPGQGFCEIVLPMAARTVSRGYIWCIPWHTSGAGRGRVRCTNGAHREPCALGSRRLISPLRRAQFRPSAARFGPARSTGRTVHVWGTSGPTTWAQSIPAPASPAIRALPCRADS